MIFIFGLLLIVFHFYMIFIALLDIYSKFINKAHVNSKFKIVGIIGSEQNAKNTVINYLCKKYNFIRINLDDPAKNICSILFGFNNEQIYGTLKETPDMNWFGLTPRKICQFVATDLFRNRMKFLHENFQEHFWLLSAKKYIDIILEKDGYVVISDITSPDECQMIKKLGGILIRINRSCVNDNNHDLSDSENILETLKVDYELINDSSINKLNKKIDSILLN